MKRRGIIEESHTPWRSPMVVAPKPEGTMRLCIVFTEVNTVSVFDAFPIPHIEEMLEKIGQAQFISTLD